MKPSAAFPARSLAGLVLALLLLAPPSHAGALFDPQSIKVESSGVYSIHGLSFGMALYDSSWSCVSQKALEPAKGYPQATSTAWKTQGGLKPKSGGSPILLQEKIECLGDGSFRAIYHADGLRDVPFNVLALQAEMPVDFAAGKTIEVDGAPLVLPANPADKPLLDKQGVRKVVLPAEGGTLTLEGDLNLFVQDARQWEISLFRARIAMATGGKHAGAADLAVTMEYKPYRIFPLSIASQANRGFRDDVAGDQKGGWTDQGPDNDLSTLQPGPLRAGDLHFEVIDPARNQGRSCLVLGGGNPKALPAEAVLPLPDHPVLANLYLLHAGAYIPSGKKPVGTIRVRYVDGAAREFEVVSHRDVGDWWSASPLPNAAVGWVGKNASSDIGLYVSKFPLENKAVAEVRFHSVGEATWMIVGLTGSPDEISLASSFPLVIKPGANWIPYEQKFQIQPGSVFDFSALADAPAGKYGRLIATKEGHFAFVNRPGVTARFWGVNLTFGANYLDKEQADQLADQLVRSGYNTVRLHHYDGALVQNGAHSYDLNPEPLDKLDYLFSAFKRRGLYVNIDLYTIRKFSKEEVPDLGREVGGDIKELLPVSDAAFDAWKRFARNLLTHRNPYTGMTWGEDPALIGICPVNEDPLFMTLEAAPAAIQKIYREKFQQWVSRDALVFSGEAEKNALYNRFLAETQARSDARMAQFLRSIGVQTLLTGVNCGTHEALTFVRERYDYVDNHTYLDHPKFLEKSWSLPTQFGQPNTIEFAGQVMREIMPCRVFSKPYTVTEIHFCWPNAYRSSGGILSAAYAGLQDWDAVYNFDYAGTTKGVTAPREAHIFHLVNDPVGLLADRAASVVFRRGDIQPAKGGVCFAVNEKTAYSGDWGKPHWYPAPFSLIGLVTRIGSLAGSAETVLSSAMARQAGVAAAVGEGAQNAQGIYPVSQDLPQRLAQDGVIPAASIEAGGNRFVSETGQIELVKNPGAMKVTSDRSELFALGPHQKQQGRIVSVDNGETFGSAYILSVDGKPLAQSERLLVLYLTDSLNAGVQFKNEKATILENNGALPFLVKRGSSKIALRLPEMPGTTWQAWAVDANGARLQPVPLQRAGGVLLLQAGPTVENAGALAYELKRSGK